MQLHWKRNTAYALFHLDHIPIIFSDFVGRSQGMNFAACLGNEINLFESERLLIME